MDENSFDAEEVLKPAHVFSPEEELKLGELHGNIIGHVHARDRLLEERINGCWPDIVKIIAIYLAMKPEEKITERALRDWLINVKACSRKLSDLLSPSDLNRQGMALLESHRASDMAQDKDQANAVFMRFEVTRFLQMLCQTSGTLADLTSGALKLFPSKGGKPKHWNRILLSQGIVSLFYKHDIPVSASSDDALAVIVVNEILTTFAAPGEKVGTARPYVKLAIK